MHGLVEFVPGLTCRHVPEADGHAKILCRCGAGTIRIRLRRDRERTPLLPGVDVPEPDGRHLLVESTGGGRAAERQERLAIRQERHHGFPVECDPVGEPVRRDVVEPNPAFLVVHVHPGFVLLIKEVIGEPKEFSH